MYVILHAYTCTCTYMYVNMHMKVFILYYDEATLQRKMASTCTNHMYSRHPSCIVKYGGKYSLISSYGFLRCVGCTHVHIMYHDTLYMYIFVQTPLFQSRHCMYTYMHILTSLHQRLPLTRRPGRSRCRP